jgi:hypothetical protein
MNESIKNALLETSSTETNLSSELEDKNKTFDKDDIVW